MRSTMLDGILDALGDDDTPIEIDHASINCTDVGNAERFVILNSRRVRYIPQWKRWLIWNGSIWQQDEANQILELAKRVTEAIILAAGTTNKELSKFGFKSQSADRLRAMVALASSDPRIIVNVSQLDTDPDVLAVRNGTLDLRSGELRPHRREDLITKMIPVEYDARATHPTWTRFLDRVLGNDQDLAAFVQRAVGYSLTGSVEEHALFILHGSGKNGKSTFATVLQSLLGPYAVQVPETLLLEKRGDSHPTELATLKGARLAIASETPKDRAFDDNRVKHLTGGDRITARRVHQDFWEFDPTHKFWISTNNKPSTRELNEAMKRRLRFVPFEVTIPEAERDPQLAAKLRAELTGILAWAVAGALEWRAFGLGTAERVKAATDDYFKSQDVVGRFLADCTDRSGESPARSLYSAYQTWEIGEPVSESDFGRRLGELGYDRKRTKHGNVWGPVQLKPLS